MINVTDAAIKRIKEFLSENNIDSAIRVTLMEGGCSGPALGIVLDSPMDRDKKITCQQIDFIIHEDMLEQCGAVTIDFAEPDNPGCTCSSGGFKITSEKPVSPLPSCSCGA